MSFITSKDLKRFERLMSQFKQQIKAKMLQYGKWATGKTWNSIEPYAEETGGILSIGLTTSEPIPVKALETGRKAGRIPAGFMDLIYQWSIAKGIAFKSDKERRTFAYLTARKILREGTLQFKHGKNTDIYTSLESIYETQIIAYLDKLVGSTVKAQIDFL